MKLKVSSIVVIGVMILILASKAYPVDVSYLGIDEKGVFYVEMENGFYFNFLFEDGVVVPAAELYQKRGNRELEKTWNEKAVIAAYSLFKFLAKIG
jgi:hypothetical protein